MAVIKVAKDHFEQEDLKAKQPIILDLWAAWCGPCQVLMPVMEGIAQEERQIKICKINVDEEPEFMMEYAPTVRNNIDGEVYKLLEHMQTCVAKGTSKIYAKQLERNVKVFTEWDENKYYRGQVGDFIACRDDDIHDIYVIQKDIFYKTYEEIAE